MRFKVINKESGSERTFDNVERFKENRYVFYIYNRCLDGVVTDVFGKDEYEYKKLPNKE